MKNLSFLLFLSLLFSCQSPAPENGTKKETKVMEVPPVAQYFEEINVVKMHLFATSAAMPNAEDYPYSGKELPTEAIKYLGEGLQPNGGGKAYACYRTENSGHYILRIPGKTTPSELALAQWDKSAGQLVKLMDLAYQRCNAGLCQQQDAWLADLDDSRTLELIVRKRTRDDSGAVSDESFEVLTDDGTGHFIKTNEQLASLAVKENYVMQ
ncbi:MAG: hypothetical protein R2825_16515 [Saprospiraceae bacterium]